VKDSKLSPSHPDWKTLPLSRRTELRLQNMERFTAQLRSTSRGWDARSLAMENSVRSLGQYLVEILREEELNSEPH